MGVRPEREINLLHNEAIRFLDAIWTDRRDQRIGLPSSMALAQSSRIVGYRTFGRARFAVREWGSPPKVKVSGSSEV